MSEDFSSRTLREAPWGPTVTRIISAALAAVDPHAAMQATLKIEGGNMLVDGQSYGLNDFERIIVVGAGKAAVPMANATLELLGSRLTDGLIITKDGHADSTDRIGPIQIKEAAHPLPDQRGVDATRQMLEQLQQTTEQDLVICLISGGGSALLAAPVEGLSLNEYREVTNALLARGAPIQEVNTLRKQLDVVKGGGLGQAAAPAQVISFILSDVVGDPLDIIASGPTINNPSTLQDAIKVIDRYDLGEFIPSTIYDSWQNISTVESLSFSAHNLIIANNAAAIEAAMHQAQLEAYQAQRIPKPFEGEARELGLAFAHQVQALAATVEERPLLLVAGGESTVTLQGDGLGGRNQELALAVVETLAGIPNVALITLATDGDDGPTDAAGAVVTDETLARAQAIGLEPDTYLSKNDSYHFFKAVDDLIITGPTQTNVNDLIFLFAF